MADRQFASRSFFLLAARRWWWWTLGFVADMQVAWEALLAQAQANRDQAHANRVTADALLLAMSKEHGCGEPPFGDELQAWFHDAREVVAVGTASVLIGGDVGEAIGGNSSCGVEAVVAC